MKPKLLLRIASISMLLYTVGHITGILSWKKAPSAGNGFNTTQNSQFQIIFRELTIDNFQNGYNGISTGFVQLFVSVLLWLLSTSYNKTSIVITGIFLLVLAIAEYNYFYPLPAIFSLVSALCCFVAAMRQKVIKPMDNFKE